MGVHTIPVPRTEVSRTGVNTTAIDTQIQRAEYETIDITVLKRGIIGVNKIGYAPYKNKIGRKWLECML